MSEKWPKSQELLGYVRITEVIREASRRRSLEREAELEKSNVAGAKREQSEES